MKTTISNFLKSFPILLILLLFGGTGSSQSQIPWPDSTHKHNGRKVKCIQREKIIAGKPEEVFAFMDDIGNTGRHMTQENASMMMSKLELQWLTDYKTGLGTKYRWTGKVAGMKMDFTVEVKKWLEGKEKIWETVGEAEMIVINWFRMFLTVSETEDGRTIADLGILYTKPKGRLWAFLLGRRYSIWCVKSMLKDTQKHFKKLNRSPLSSGDLIKAK